VKFYLTQLGLELLEGSRSTKRAQRKADAGAPQSDASVAAKVVDRLQRDELGDPKKIDKKTGKEIPWSKDNPRTYKKSASVPPIARAKNVAASKAEVDAYNQEQERVTQASLKHGVADPEVYKNPRTTKVLRRAASRSVG
jgi:hypothetical protein